ncbi:MAG: phosphoribosyl-AMP cyclohydrolase [Candidatus Omnitrophota bacterium]|nr:MAG: phosphoribosyl-AMP cyclohydrolase [Candidatus Omnitrophota bacterium]
MKLNFNEKGLIPAIIQDYKTGKVLTLCYMNEDALNRSLAEGKICVFRRSKNKVMLKGEVSGNIQAVREVFVDCCNNSVLFKVEQKTAACHDGYFTCYFRKIDKDGNEKIAEKRVFNPKDVYKAE